MGKVRLSVGVIVLVASFLLGGARATAADWPQWRGPDRSNVSREKGLTNEWPNGGPPLAWKATGLDDGVAPVTVSADRVFTTGNEGENVVCTALSAKDGKQLWATKLGPAAKEMGIMRWLAQMSPTVDGDRVYAVTANGDYVCLAADSGREIWRKHFAKDFDGKKSNWGFCDYPLVDGDRLVLTPGGQKAALVALNKMTGEPIWSCSLPEADTAAHAVLAVADIGGTRQYVNHLSKRMVGVAAQDGKLLWQYDGLKTQIATTHAPIIRNGQVFYASGYGVGHALLTLGQADSAWKVVEEYRQRSRAYVPWLGSPTALDDGVMVNTSSGLQWVDWKTGSVLWEEKSLGRCTYTVADGKVFVRTQSGRMLLGTAAAKGWSLVSEFSPPKTDAKDRSMDTPAYTFPVVANGYLYIRDFDSLSCYDVRAPERPQKQVPDAVFVPTPADVVRKMLQMAAVTKDDLVYDLGSGDGRIVIAAAQTYGCKAIGIEIEKDLVALSRVTATAAGCEKLATFEHGDIFEADFSKANVVALYILPAMSQKLIPKLDKLKPGSRVVSHYFAIPDVVPDKVIKITSEEDGVERPVYLYSVPLKREKSRN